MREIKFTGIDLKLNIKNGHPRNVWRHGSLIEYDNGQMGIVVNATRYGFGVFIKEVIPETVGQYTGLRDKNGKEIYEGDILQWREVYDNGEELSLENYEVIHKDGGFHVKNIKGNFPRFEPISEILSFLYCFKVIGNVYENPQLLKAVE